MVTLTMHRELNIVEKRGPLCDAPSLKEKKRVNVKSNLAFTRKLISNQNVYITMSH